MWYCCVPTCKNNNRCAKMFRFPYLDEPVFNVWIERIGNPKLKDLHPAEVYKSYRVCHHIFASFCIHNIESKKPLIERSLPTINVPGFGEEPSKSNAFLLYDTGHSTVTVDRNQPCTSATIAYAETAGSTKTGDNVEIIEESLIKQDATAVGTPKKRKASAEPCIFDTPKTRKDVRKRFNLLRAISVQRASQLTPRKQKLYRAAKNLRKISLQLDRECANTKTRLERATDFVQTEEFLKSTVNKTSYQFIMSQLRLQKLKPKGRRFSEEEKILALTLFKNSAKNYALLQRIFALPSRATLRSLLGKVSIKCGISKKLMSSIEKSAMKMGKEDRMCSIVFDETAVSSSLSYNIKHDFIEGFEDVTDGERRQKFADHVLVFMACGLREKWKQPLAFYFVQSGAKTADLVRLLKEVILAAENAGLQVMNTVCDQHSTNKAAIKELIRQTTENYLRKREEKRSFGFEINQHEVIPFFDPPHLLKGIRNNLLKGDCLFSWKRQNQKASWKVFKDCYEFDAPTDSDYRLFYNLSDEHIYEERMRKMKVGLAAQILSQRMASNVSFLVRQGILPAEAADTADFSLFFDKLFDSVNGNRINPEKGKCAVSEKSPIILFGLRPLRCWNQ